MPYFTKIVFSLPRRKMALFAPKLLGLIPVGCAGTSRLNMVCLPPSPHPLTNFKAPFTARLQHRVA